MLVFEPVANGMRVTCINECFGWRFMFFSTMFSNQCLARICMESRTRVLALSSLIEAARVLAGSTRFLVEARSLLASACAASRGQTATSKRRLRRGFLVV